ncbi:hypothetical protein [Jejuia pallidilutea]|uniref:NlpE C-terminal OB domain-containing protein n=1 Tax=Jejuia pallidilutea TaxID=504487 RepID=A0A090VSZ3_9FLAO|nr:hypothetical protein [Jejuia pallidilutea]GAL66399.1 hypothetical protein JCM19301_2494 [Jejuia pallidilutea]GAL69651.1 hypothetical protein JCM19302_3840 [Jejuia pallidilutea]GAL87899.1 hypothetical protein JCM19538_2262 [Jejuia pallidilutea]
MKKLLFITLIVVAFTSCKSDKKTENYKTPPAQSDKKTANNSDELTLLKGEFVYYDGAAVLQTNTEIYGVLLTNKFKELNDRAERFKTNPTDYVIIEIRGRITNEAHEKILWANKVEVVEILSVKPSSEENNTIVKLGS